MNISQFGAVVLAAAATTALASAASAQTTPTPPPAGPALPGICVLSKDRMIFGSVVGKYIVSRLDQLKAQADAELNSENTAIVNDAKTLEGQQATLPPDQYQQRGALINQRVAALQRKAQMRSREITATQDKAFSHISVEVDPIIRQVFTQHSCSLLFDGAALIYPAPAMDVTDAVIHGMDGKIQQFPFDREHLDQQSDTAPR
jgi:Skp family chaperone for outer membrane proteins